MTGACRYGAGRVAAPSAIATSLPGARIVWICATRPSASRWSARTSRGAWRRTGRASVTIAPGQQELTLRNLELSIATEVRTAGRNVNTNRRRVDSTRAARILTLRQLEAAQKKFSVGLATSLDVLVAQRDLTNARNNELTAIIDYVRSLVDFEAVQEAGVGAGLLVSGPAGNGGR